jgi:hypothetical protein
MTAAVLLLVAFAMAATAQRVQLDDSFSPIESYAVELQWSATEINRALRALQAGAADALPAMSARIPNVEVRLDTRAFVGRAARIYLRLPTVSADIGSPADLELRWEASGAFLAGAVHPGQSTLVFDGPVEQPVTSVIFDFVLLLENSGVGDSFGLEPVYEIEVLP